MGIRSQTDRLWQLGPPPLGIVSRRGFTTSCTTGTVHCTSVCFAGTHRYHNCSHGRTLPFGVATAARSPLLCGGPARPCTVTVPHHAVCSPRDGESLRPLCQAQRALVFRIAPPHNTDAQAARGVGPLPASCVENRSSLQITGLCILLSISGAALSVFMAGAKTSTTTAIHRSSRLALSRPGGLGRTLANFSIALRIRTAKPLSAGHNKSTAMILLQVHLQQPCYDFCFL